MRYQSGIALIAIVALVPMIIRATAAGTLSMQVTIGLLIALMALLAVSHKLFAIVSAILSVGFFFLGNSQGRGDAGVLLASVLSLALMLLLRRLCLQRVRYGLRAAVYVV